MRLRTPVTFHDACAQLEAAANGSTRREIVDQLLSGQPGTALDRLRSGMREHRFPVASGTLALRRIVDSFDAKSQREGLHVVQPWDFQAHRFTEEIAPVMLVDYCVRLKRSADERAAVAILLDQYFLTVLSLLSVRAWDDGDANENLDRVSALVRAVQGPDGSGHPFVDDAETLLFLAVSYYHPNEDGYGLLLEKVRALDEKHRVRVAGPCAAMLGAHLRWGLRFMYQRDVGAMRADNVVDYPWLLFAVDTLARAGATESMLDGLSADPWAFTGELPAALSDDAAQHAALRAWLRERGTGFLDEIASQQSSPKAYSPLSWACNFPLNAAVAEVAIALEDGRAYPSLNALFAREPQGARPERSAGRLAERLMQYSASDPGRLGAGGAPLMVYDPADGAHVYNSVVRTVREFLGQRASRQPLNKSLGILSEAAELPSHPDL